MFGQLSHPQLVRIERNVKTNHTSIKRMVDRHVYRYMSDKNKEYTLTFECESGGVPTIPMVGDYVDLCKQKFRFQFLKA